MPKLRIADPYIRRREGSQVPVLREHSHRPGGIARSASAHLHTNPNQVWTSGRNKRPYNANHRNGWESNGRSHGWRHRFKTVGIEAGIEHRILDSIQGHRPRNVAEGYGEVTIRTQAAAVDKLPRYKVLL